MNGLISKSGNPKLNSANSARVDPGPIWRRLGGMAMRNVISESEISMSGLPVTGAAADKSECGAAAITTRYLTSSSLHAGHVGGQAKYKCNI